MKNNSVFFSLIMVIKYTKLYDSRAYDSVSILPTRFFRQGLGIENTNSLDKNHIKSQTMGGHIYINL